MKNKVLRKIEKQAKKESKKNSITKINTETELYQKMIKDFMKYKQDVSEATGIIPNMVIIGKKVEKSLKKLGLTPVEEYNTLLLKWMNYWGKVYGMDIWGQIS